MSFGFLITCCFEAAPPVESAERLRGACADARRSAGRGGNAAAGRSRRLGTSRGLFGSNFYFFRTSGGYFDDPSFSMPLLHTWSLAIEEQYYLLWPLLMLLVFRWAGVARAGAMRVRVVWVLAVMLLLSLTLCIGTTPDYQNFAFYLLPARVWEFALGGIVGLAGTAFHSRLQRWAEGLSVLGLSLIVCSVAGLNYRTPFPGWAAIFPVLGSAVLIVGMSANEHGFVRRMLAVRPLVFIGLLSYSWYLWHWPLLSIYRIYTLGTQNMTANARAC
ncbi:MAG: acyltransferase [Propionivibrio sp.]|nr:acyltransferase [Propionivibrio sp.]